MLKLVHLISNKFSFVYHSGNRTYKVFTPWGKAFRIAEEQGNQGALSSEFWMNQVLQVTPRVFFLEMKRGKSISLSERQIAAQFMESKLQTVSTYPLRQAHEAYDFDFLTDLEKYGLDAGLLVQAEEILKSVYLPVTSAHGDLHVHNMVRFNQEVKIIDWSMFTGKGSFVTDYIHFFNYQVAEQNRESWTKAIVKEQQVLEVLAQKFNSTPDHLRLVYAISRISGAVSQRKNFSRIPKKEIGKYNSVLNHIINEALVQHNNTGV